MKHLCLCLIENQVGGAPLQSIIKSLSFAPQRWNSEDEPLRRFGVMVQEIAVLLAAQASDARQTPDFRARCQTSLEKLTPRFLLDAGLASDWSNEVLRYLRSHDRDLHDPALTARQYADFKNRLEALFLKLHILDSDTGGIGSETLTKIIVKQAMSCGPIRYGDRVHYLWTGTSRSDVKRACLSLMAVVDSCLSRLDSEMRLGLMWKKQGLYS